jgi:K+-sensing histidine kinase KdpD
MQRKSLRELVLPIALSLAAILLTSLILVEAHSLLSFLHVWRDPEDLALAYLLPTIFIAVFFGSTIAVMSSFASGLGAAYFIYPPQFSVMIDDPEHVAELGFIIVLAITASKAVAVITNDKPLVRSAFRCKRTWPRGSLMKLDLRSPHSAAL